MTSSLPEWILAAAAVVGMVLNHIFIGRRQTEVAKRTAVLAAEVTGRNEETLANIKEMVGKAETSTKEMVAHIKEMVGGVNMRLDKMEERYERHATRMEDNARRMAFVVGALFGRGKDKEQQVQR